MVGQSSQNLGIPQIGEVTKSLKSESKRNLKAHGTAIVSVIYGDYEYIATACDGRCSQDVTLDNTPKYEHACGGTTEKVFDICGDYMATISGWGHYGLMAIEEIKTRYENNDERFSMAEIVEQVKDFCVAQWKEDSADESDEGWKEDCADQSGDAKDQEFPATVVVYGLNGEHIITSNPNNVGYEKLELENGKKVTVVFHGRGAGYASKHVSMFCEKISSSSIKTMHFLLEAIGVGAIHDPSVGGYFLGASLTRVCGVCPDVRIYREERPHFAAVVARNYESVEFLLPDSLLLLTKETYLQNPEEEAIFEKKLKKKFQLESIAFVGVGRGVEAVRLLNFKSAAAKSFGESILRKWRMTFHDPSQAVFDQLATRFVDPEN